jgi:ethylmalonyl-CoA/methylmalonyl-CoA decarboxylase
MLKFKVNTVNSIRKLYSKSYLSSQSLVEKHLNFLSLVQNEGDGEITVEINKKCKVAILSIKNPSKRNSISGRMMYQLAEHIDSMTFQKDRYLDVIGLIIRGDEYSFCSGADLKLAKNTVNTPELGYKMSLFMSDALNRLRNDIPLISVSVLNGPAIGGGAEFATASDFRVMKSDSYIRFVHAKLGASPGWGGTSRLFSIVGRNQALEILGTSKKLEPAYCLNCKFIDEIVETDKTCVDMGIEFLKPYLDQKYFQSIRSIKIGVVAASKYDVHNANEIASLEFSKRWASP